MTSHEDLAAIEAIEAALNEHAADISPTGDGIPSEWVLIVNWVGQEDGNVHMASIIPPHMLISHRSGLLFEALHGEWHRGGED